MLRVLHQLMLYPLKGKVGCVFDRFVEEEGQHWHDGKTRYGRTPRFDLRVLRINKCLLRLFHRSVYGERW